VNDYSQSGEAFASERVVVPPIGKKFEVFVYSLDRRKQTRGPNLVLVKIEGHRGVPEFTIADELYTLRKRFWGCQGRKAFGI